ncbi:hypothetical protein NG99_05430 [Erwinia typographi]|uniref:Cellulose biosynthesis protein BcsO n=1 Tax=Erwinia typographi TaxID=371042 RepID=A0A0A3Z7P6_9GAMM|nr:cellulose biosynthesis protein BcsO [Erwinia typographi]KGT95077.1 hypothetical protein NG99_05430 [Erwinia typographi]
MKSYDDLQRFKEKTQTNHIDFKDMSEQTKNSDSANWAIIKQLMNEGAETGLGNGQSIDVPAPQPIAEDTFIAPAAPVARPQPAVQSHSVAAFVAKPAATQIGASLLDSISASLKPTPAADPLTTAQPAPAANPLTTAQPAPAANPLTAAQPAPAADPLTAAQPAQAANPLTTARPAATSLLASLPTAPPAAARTAPGGFAPAAAPQPAAELPRFKQLFSSTPESSLTVLSKETLLQPLLERIASCR